MTHPQYSPVYDHPSSPTSSWPERPSHHGVPFICTDAIPGMRIFCVNAQINTDPGNVGGRKIHPLHNNNHQVPFSLEEHLHGVMLGGEVAGASLVPTNDLYKTWGPAEPHQFLHPAPLSSR